MAVLKAAGGLTLGLLLLTSVSRASAAERERAPDFVLPDLTGREERLSEHRGRVVLLDFWATWCGACAPQLQCLDALATRHGDVGVDVIAVSIDHDRRVVERFVQERFAHDGLTLLHDGGGEVLARYGAEGLPALYLIDRAGRIRAKHAGAGGCEAVATELERLLALDPATLVSAPADP